MKSTTRSTTGAAPTSKLGSKGEALKTGQRDIKPIRRLMPFVLRYPWRLTFTIGFLLISTLSSLVIPTLAGKIIDKGFVEQNLAMVGQYGMIAIGVALVMALASAGRFYFISVLGERVLTDLRRKVFDHLLTLDSAFFDLHRVGELTSRLNGDVATIRGAIGTSLSIMLRGAVTLIGAVTLMFLTSPYLALTIVIVGPAILIPVMLYARRLRRMSRRTQDALADMSAMATEALGASKTIKSFVQEPVQSRLYGSHAEASFEAEVSRVGARAALLGGLLFLSTAALVVLVWWGANAVFTGVVTVGELAQFMIYALMASNALTNLSEIMGLLHTVSGATERLVEILDTEPAIKPPLHPEALPVPPLGTVAFEQVNFVYETRDSEAVISDMSFAIAHGETVALVGASGAGKSTLFALVQRFYDVTAGRILVDGIDVRDVEPEQLRRRFAYVEQEPTIFAGTIADNIRFGRPEATFAEIEAAARAALVHDYVSELSNGYDSIVGERGVMLSGGQKQRLAIARALLKDAPILLLDEATSALDAESERLVQLALERLMTGRTTLVIAHRLATIRDADRILVLEKGRLIDQGTHDQLVKKGGKYAELARLQFRAELQREVAE
ncbi:MAG TPA: ABC transporter transmembrane domain-containing protein [Devosia sp.]|uniref:ABC transporter transmembrane domain-containing protein n=1 Tax=Devosia sp. TaxID=1871048 RepID=UPI002DDCFDB9|nr:ABC transporter transmembrane domain-containing protein [Devosia sp.]HEV2518931.1 ABC transporter transmembrane domain-containing protein [Devosia sp.]